MKLDADTLGTLEQARQQLFQAHHGDPNFTGCAIGFRRRAGRVTDEPAVIAMVINKRPAGTLSRQRLLPQTVQVDGQPCGVDVVSVGPLTFASTRAEATDVTGPITGIFRPPLQGCGISNVNNGTTGTFGCLVTDNSDGTLCLLGSNHVLGRDGAAVTGEVITQPAVADGGGVAFGIGFLKRTIPFGSGTNDVDAAIAQFTDQSHYSQNVVDDLMAPISASHPAVGMVVADDSASCEVNCFLSRMDLTVSALGVTLLAATDSSSAIVAPEVGMAIEKAGRTTAYTSSTVDAIGAQVKVQYSGTYVTLSDLIWTQAFSQPGDSGAVACQGGNGETYASPPAACQPSADTCPLLSAIGTYYDVPLNSSANNTLADEFRDNFLAQSNTGQLLIGTTYLNMQVAINRLNTDTGTAHNQSIAQARAQALYSEYQALATTLIGSTSPTAVVTSSQVNGVASILFGLTAPVSLGGAAMLTAAESAAAWTVYSDVLTHAVGMDRHQLIDYLNQSSVFQTVHDQLAAVPTIQVSGTVSAD